MTSSRGAQLWRALAGLVLLVSLQVLGALLVVLAEIPLPGPVAGMLLLLAGLFLFGERLLAWVAPAADLLLRHLSLLFLAPTVLLVLEFDRYAAWSLPLALAVFVSTPLAMLAMALVLKPVARRQPLGDDEAA